MGRRVWVPRARPVGQPVVRHVRPDEGQAETGFPVNFEQSKALAQARSFGQCEGCGLPGRLDPHHRMTRGSGGVHGDAAAVSHDVRNLLMLCRICHDRTLSDPIDCIALGWMVERRAGIDPREVSAHIYTVNGRGWWFLTADAGYRWDDLANMTPHYYWHNYKIEEE